MASGKQSPRQKMINMMYLVLTALLALNISKEILHAFAVVEDGYASTVEALDEKNKQRYEQFNKVAENLEKAKEQLPIANSVKVEAKAIVDHIEKLREDIIAIDGENDEIDPDLGKKLPEKMDDKEGVANMLLQLPKRGEKLRFAVDKYRNFLLDLKIVKDKSDLMADIEKAFNTDERKLPSGGMQKWENRKFEHFPKIAILTFLRQIEADVVKAESEVVDALFTSVGKSEFSFDKLTAMIVPESSSLMTGEKFKADIFVTAFDSKQTPKIKWQRSYNGENTDFSNGTDLETVEDGRGKLEFTAAGVGEHTVAAEVEITKSNGQKESWNTFTKYTVNAPTAVVSPTKMNVFYIGVENPIAVSVPGVDSKGVRINVSGASSKAIGKGTYNISLAKNTKTSTKVKIGVTANGRTIGKPHEFRVKRIPNPLATISGKIQGTVSKGLILGTPGIRATLKDFPYDIRFNVSSFIFTIKDGDYVSPIRVRGAKFTPEIREKIKKAKPGTSVSFTNIKAKGPAGVGVKSCPPIVFTVQ